MNRRVTAILSVLGMLFLSGSAAWGALSDYAFSVGTGSQISLGKSETILWGYTSGQASKGGTLDAVKSIDVGFSFRFNGTAYTKLSISTNGVIGLGTTSVTTSGSNDLTGANVPVIAPWWDQLRVSGGGQPGTYGVDRLYPQVSYGLSGSAPNRVLTIQYQDMDLLGQEGSCFANAGTWQVRLYETTNKIEFWYGRLNPCSLVDYDCYEPTDCENTSSSIGLAAGNSDFISVTPSGSSATSSLSTANNSVNLNGSNTITSGTMYTFQPCALTPVGNIAQGGTTAMAAGDTLLTGFQVQRGNAGTRQPFSLNFVPVSACATRSYSFTIGGANASDFQISPSSGSLSFGGSVTPTITFTPGGTGMRYATLIVNDNNTSSTTYVLAANGTTRIQWAGTVAQGGTSTVANGDTLMKNITVLRKVSGTFRPLTITNINSNTAAPLARITFSIDSAGFPSTQFSVAPTDTMIGALGTVSPRITFTPNGVGFQEATLRVNADGEVRTYPLKAFSAAPGAEFILGGAKLGPGVGTFINYSGCVGETANTQAITVTNVGVGDVTIDKVDFYLTDTIYRQGVPAYPLMRDQNNHPIPSYDYYITTQPGVAPMTAAQLPTLPIVIPQGQTRTIYLTFIGQYPGKRFARAYIHTNAQNFLESDLDNTLVDGLLKFDLFARAIGSSLSDNPTGGLPKPVSFPETSAGDSVDATVSIFNTGICDLRISKDHLKIFSGDVNEFKIVSAFPGTPTSGDDYVLSPGMTGTLTLRFQPSRSGTRRATVWMRTNDSTIYIPGVTNRGDYFLELYGPGKAGLDVPDVTFQSAIIDGENSIAEAMVVNSSTELLGIAQIRIIGPDAAEFAENPARKWPSPLPKGVQPGEELKLSIVHTATSGSAPGPRQAKLEITLTNGQVIIVELNGAAWTRTASASLSKPFTQTTIGALQRRVIRIENTGWAPLVLQVPTLTGLDASEFALGNLSRMVLDSGQVDFLEVTYAPTRAGTATATVTIMSNATNGVQTVTLNGSAKTARGDVDVDDGAITIGRENEDGDAVQTGTSGVQLETRGEGMVLRQSVPNPGSGNVKISYLLSDRGQVSLVLYDARGEVVKNLAHGEQEKGEHAVTVDVSGLSSGVYHYRLEMNGHTVTRTMSVVR